jgi:hypothetical protein
MLLENQLLLNYFNGGFRSVEGWCSDNLFRIIDLLDGCEFNKEGGAAEIGVHHGKFFLLLNSVVDENYKSFAIDLFEQQHLNIDLSGRGDFDVFKSNLSNYDAHNGRNVSVISADSTDYSGKLKNLFDGQKIRFFSVDGGHTVQHTISDLNIANNTICNEGVVILDDILHSGWLGVIEGACKFLSTYPTLVPFAIGDNKLLMCKLSMYPYYFKLFDSSSLKKRNSKFFGYDLVCL